MGEERDSEHASFSAASKVACGKGSIWDTAAIVPEPPISPIMSGIRTGFSNKGLYEMPSLTSRQTQYRSARKDTFRINGNKSHEIPSAATGLKASGRKIFFSKTDHVTPSKPTANTPTPHRAPVIECVVDTGNPVFDAIMTQINAPRATATGNTWFKLAVDFTIPPTEKVFTISSAKKAATIAPAMVQIVPQRIAFL